jgi:hypothetical protein
MVEDQGLHGFLLYTALAVTVAECCSGWWWWPPPCSAWPIITIALGADFTTKRKRSSSRLRPEVSKMADSTMVTSSGSIGFRPISMGNSLPSFLRP